MIKKIVDDNGFDWTWDSTQKRVYMDEAEKEFIKAGEDVSQNGYGAKTLAEALEVLYDGGYLGGNKED